MNVHRRSPQERTNHQDKEEVFNAKSSDSSNVVPINQEPSRLLIVIWPTSGSFTSSICTDNLCLQEQKLNINSSTTATATTTCLSTSPHHPIKCLCLCRPFQLTRVNEISDSQPMELILNDTILNNYCCKRRISLSKLFDADRHAIHLLQPPKLTGDKIYEQRVADKDGYQVCGNDGQCKQIISLCFSCCCCCCLYNTWPKPKSRHKRRRKREQIEKQRQHNCQRLTEMELDFGARGRFDGDIIDGSIRWNNNQLGGNIDAQYRDHNYCAGLSIIQKCQHSGDSSTIMGANCKLDLHPQKQTNLHISANNRAIFVLFPPISSSEFLLSNSNTTTTKWAPKMTPEAEKIQPSTPQLKFSFHPIITTKADLKFWSQTQMPKRVKVNVHCTANQLELQPPGTHTYPGCWCKKFSRYFKFMSFRCCYYCCHYYQFNSISISDNNNNNFHCNYHCNNNNYNYNNHRCYSRYRYHRQWSKSVANVSLNSKFTITTTTTTTPGLTCNSLKSLFELERSLSSDRKLDSSNSLKFASRLSSLEGLFVGCTNWCGHYDESSREKQDDCLGAKRLVNLKLRYNYVRYGLAYGAPVGVEIKINSRQKQTIILISFIESNKSLWNKKQFNLKVNGCYARPPNNQLESSYIMIDVSCDLAVASWPLLVVVYFRASSCSCSYCCRCSVVPESSAKCLATRRQLPDSSFANNNSNNNNNRRLLQDQTARPTIRRVQICKSLPDSPSLVPIDLLAGQQLISLDHLRWPKILVRTSYHHFGCFHCQDVGNGPDQKSAFNLAPSRGDPTDGQFFLFRCDAALISTISTYKSWPSVGNPTRPELSIGSTSSNSATKSSELHWLLVVASDFRLGGYVANTIASIAREINNEFANCSPSGPSRLVAIKLDSYTYQLPGHLTVRPEVEEGSLCKCLLVPAACNVSAINQIAPAPPAYKDHNNWRQRMSAKFKIIQPTSSVQVKEKEEIEKRVQTIIASPLPAIWVSNEREPSAELDPRPSIWLLLLLVVLISVRGLQNLVRTSAALRHASRTQIREKFSSHTQQQQQQDGKTSDGLSENHSAVATSNRKRRLVHHRSNCLKLVRVRQIQAGIQQQQLMVPISFNSMLVLLLSIYLMMSSLQQQQQQHHHHQQQQHHQHHHHNHQQHNHDRQQQSKHWPVNQIDLSTSSFFKSPFVVQLVSCTTLTGDPQQPPRQQQPHQQQQRPLQPPSNNRLYGTQTTSTGESGVIRRGSSLPFMGSGWQISSYLNEQLEQQVARLAAQAESRVDGVNYLDNASSNLGMMSDEDVDSLSELAKTINANDERSLSLSNTFESELEGASFLVASSAEVKNQLQQQQHQKQNDNDNEENNERVERRKRKTRRQVNGLDEQQDQSSISTTLTDHSISSSSSPRRSSSSTSSDSVSSNSSGNSNNNNNNKTSTTTMTTIVTTNKRPLSKLSNENNPNKNNKTTTTSTIYGASNSQVTKSQASSKQQEPQQWQWQDSASSLNDDTFNNVSITSYQQQQEVVTGSGVNFLQSAPNSGYRWPVIGLVGFMFLGASGNILVCMAVWRERRLQTGTNYFLLSLAVADLLVCTLVMPFGIIYEFYVLWRIAIAWASSALIASPITMMSLYDHKNIVPSPNECAISNRYFMIFGSLLAFFIPMFVMVPSYVMTVRLLSRRAKFVRDGSLLLTNNSNNNNATSTGPNNSTQLGQNNNNETANKLQSLETDGPHISGYGENVELSSSSLSSSLSRRRRQQKHQHQHKSVTAIGELVKQQSNFYPSDQAQSYDKSGDHTDSMRNKTQHQKQSTRRQVMHNATIIDNNNTSTEADMSSGLASGLNQQQQQKQQLTSELMAKHKLAHFQHTAQTTNHSTSSHKQSDTDMPTSGLTNEPHTMSGRAVEAINNAKAPNNGCKFASASTTTTSTNTTKAASDTEQWTQSSVDGLEDRDGGNTSRDLSKNLLPLIEHKELEQKATSQTSAAELANTTSNKQSLGAKTKPLSEDLLSNYTDDDDEEEEEEEDPEVELGDDANVVANDKSNKTTLVTLGEYISKGSVRKACCCRYCSGSRLCCKGGKCCYNETHKLHPNPNGNAQQHVYKCEISSSQWQASNCRICDLKKQNVSLNCEKCIQSSANLTCSCSKSATRFKQHNDIQMNSVASKKSGQNLTPKFPPNLTQVIDVGPKLDEQQLLSNGHDDLEQKQNFNNNNSGNKNAGNDFCDDRKSEIRIMNKINSSRGLKNVINLPTDCKENVDKNSFTQLTQQQQQQIDDPKTSHPTSGSTYETKQAANSIDRTRASQKTKENLPERPRCSNLLASNSSSYRYAKQLELESTNGTKSGHDDETIRENFVGFEQMGPIACKSQDQEPPSGSRKVENSFVQLDRILNYNQQQKPKQSEEEEQQHLACGSQKWQQNDGKNDRLSQSHLRSANYETQPIAASGSPSILIANDDNHDNDQHCTGNKDVSSLVGGGGGGEQIMSADTTTSANATRSALNGASSSSSDKGCKCSYNSVNQSTVTATTSNVMDRWKGNDSTNREQLMKSTLPELAARSSYRLVDLEAGVSSSNDTNCQNQTRQRHKHRHHNQNHRHHSHHHHHHHHRHHQRHHHSHHNNGSQISGPRFGENNDPSQSQGHRTSHHNAHHGHHRHNHRHGHHHHHHHHNHKHGGHSRHRHSQDDKTLGNALSKVLECTCENEMNNKQETINTSKEKQSSVIDLKESATIEQSNDKGPIRENASSNLTSANNNNNEFRGNKTNSIIGNSILMAAIPALPTLMRSPSATNKPNPISRNSSNNSSGAQSTTTHQTNINFSLTETNEPQMIRYLGSSMQVRSEQKATKVLGVVFFTFVICWTPFFVINFVSAFLERESLYRYISDEMLTTFQWLGYISSTINPVIYTVFNRNFRLAFRQLILCRQANDQFGNRTRNSEMNKSFRFGSQYGRSQTTGVGFNSSMYSAGSRANYSSKGLNPLVAATATATTNTVTSMESKRDSFANNTSKNNNINENGLASNRTSERGSNMLMLDDDHHHNHTARHTIQPIDRSKRTKPENRSLILDASSGVHSDDLSSSSNQRISGKKSSNKNQVAQAFRSALRATSSLFGSNQQQQQQQPQPHNQSYDSSDLAQSLPEQQQPLQRAPNNRPIDGGIMRRSPISGSSSMRGTKNDRASSANKYRLSFAQ